jgi:hypothetical protein
LFPVCAALGMRIIGSPPLCEHQEGFARIRKKKALVTHQCKQRTRTRLSGRDAMRTVEVRSALAGAVAA